MSGPLWEIPSGWESVVYLIALQSNNWKETHQAYVMTSGMWCLFIKAITLSHQLPLPLISSL